MKKNSMIIQANSQDISIFNDLVHSQLEKETRKSAFQNIWYMLKKIFKKS